MQTLREARIERFLSIRDLAAQAKISPRTVVEIEAGRFTPRFATIRKLATTLGVEPGEITEFAAARDEASERPRKNQEQP